jgi:hypothetical protein
MFVRTFDIRKKLFCSGLFFVLLCFSVVPSVEATSMWSQTYKGAMTLSIVATPDGGYAFTSQNASLVKIDAFGNTQWNRTYMAPSPWTYTAYCLIATPDGGYALAGGCGDYSSYLPHFQAWLAKTDAFGNMEWNQTYDTLDSHSAFNSLVAASDGGYVLASPDLLVKTDGLGNILWNRTSEGYYRSLVVTSDGGYAIAGSKWVLDGGTSSSGSDDFLLVKTNSNGTVEWERTYGGVLVGGFGGEDRAFALVATSDGGYALSGHTGFVDWDFWLVKTDRFGVLQWSKTYGGVGSEEAHSLVNALDGGYAIAGYTQSFGAGKSDFWLVKTDASGNMEWSQTFGGALWDDARSLVAVSNGGYVVAGDMDTYNDGGLVKTDGLGVIPEFSSWIAPLLVLAAAVPILVNRKGLLRRCS